MMAFRTSDTYVELLLAKFVSSWRASVAPQSSAIVLSSRAKEHSGDTVIQDMTSTIFPDLPGQKK